MEFQRIVGSPPKTEGEEGRSWAISQALAKRGRVDGEDKLEEEYGGQKRAGKAPHAAGYDGRLKFARQKKQPTRSQATGWSD